MPRRTAETVTDRGFEKMRALVKADSTLNRVLAPLGELLPLRGTLRTEVKAHDGKTRFHDPAMTDLCRRQFAELQHVRGFSHILHP